MTPLKASLIVATARAKFRVPTIAVVTMSSAGIDFEGIQGSRVVVQPDPAMLDDYFPISAPARNQCWR
jgi:hypothetical protein